MLFCARKQWLYAAVAFALAGAFRSNGITLAGFLIWGLLIAPLLERRKRPVSDGLPTLMPNSSTPSDPLIHNHPMHRIRRPRLRTLRLPSIYRLPRFLLDLDE